jgi:hypothetical protein
MGGEAASTLSQLDLVLSCHRSFGSRRCAQATAIDIGAPVNSGTGASGLSRRPHSVNAGFRLEKAHDSESFSDDQLTNGRGGALKTVGRLIGNRGRRFQMVRLRVS